MLLILINSIYALIPLLVVYYLVIIVFMLELIQAFILQCSFSLATLEAHVLVGDILLSLGESRVQAGARLWNKKVLFVTTKCTA